MVVWIGADKDQSTDAKMGIIGIWGSEPRILLAE
ncbi:hypothetical protein SLEP1_g4546 [Rubroshorea leprosula]|uniref:Uncharacterized protein n=1 Tax=Rubroshorea leprosula TaxID=152421 RepID=A0AAV5HZI1_9ROSI|nr:hypothetical protein SLEP1_g4546 [Rubroshorea leprosula]